MNRGLISSLIDKNWILLILAFSAIFGRAIQASEASENAAESRPDIGTRPLSQTEWSLWSAMHAEQSSCNEEKSSIEETPNHLIAVPVTNKSDELGEDEARLNSEYASELTLKSRTVPKARSVYYTTHPGVYRHPNIVWGDGSHIELDDGSVWSVNIYDRNLPLFWWTDQTLLVMPNYEGLFRYKLVNQQTGDYVRVNLEKAPYYTSAYFITDIDYFSGKVWLNDGTVWTISFSDSIYSSRWLPNDSVIMGFNDGPLWDLYPNILINISTLDYSRSKCLY